MADSTAKQLDRVLRRVEQTSVKLEDICHGDVVTDPQIDALATAVAAQAEAIQEIGRVLKELVSKA